MHRPIIFILLALFLLLAACSPRPLARPQPDGIAVLLAPGAAGAPMKAAAEAFEDETGAQVAFISVPADQYADRVNAYLLSGQSAVDLLYIPPGDLPAMAAYHALLETRPGEPAWVPQREVEALWARRDWLDEAGLTPPAVLDNFFAAAQALARPPERYAVAFSAGPYDAGFDYTPFSAALRLGDPWVNESAAHIYQDFYSNGLALPTSPSLGRGEVLAALRDGKVAFAFLPLTAADDILKCPGAASCQGDASLLEPLPLGGAGDTPLLVAREGGWAIPLKAARAADALKLVEALHSPGPVQDAWILAGGFPITPDPLSSEVAARRPYLQSFHPAMGRIDPYPDYLHAQPAWAAFHETIHRLAAGEITPAEAARLLQAEIDAARKTQGRR